MHFIWLNIVFMCYIWIPYMMGCLEINVIDLMYFCGVIDGGIRVVVRRQGDPYFCDKVVAQRGLQKIEERSPNCTTMQFLKEFA